MLPRRTPRALGFVVVAALSLLGSHTVSHAVSHGGPDPASTRPIGVVSRTAVAHVQGIDHVGRLGPSVTERSTSDHPTSRRAHQPLTGTGTIWRGAVALAAALAAVDLGRQSIGGRRRLVSRGPPTVVAF